MTLALDAVPPTRSATGPRLGILAWRYAVRELRGGLSGFYVFIACIALGVMAIAGVGSLAASLADGLAAQGRVLLGGDASFALIQREATPAELSFLHARGEVAVTASLRAMVKAPGGDFALAEVKAVDGHYPLLGAATLDPKAPLADLLAPRGDAFGAVADPVLLARLNLKPGDPVEIAAARFVITGVINGEPDKLLAGVGLGPRFMISDQALRATGLLQPGSLIRWTYRVKLPDAAGRGATQALVADARATLPDAGWEIRSRDNASPQLERNIERFTQFLTLVGLAALLVGGVGVANAVKSHIDRRRDSIAVLKSLGATGNDVFAIYLAQVVLLALCGAALGIVVGAALPFVVAGIFGAILPLPLAPALHPGELALALLYGLLTALAFALWPLGRVHDVAVAALFRDAVAGTSRWPRRRYLIVTAAAVALLAAAAIGLSYDKRVAAVFVGAAAAALVLLRGVAAAVMALARRLPRPRSAGLRLAIGNIYRPGALTPSVVLSLGLGLTVLVTITQIDGNLRRQFEAALPDHAPSFFFLDIPAADADRFGAFLQAAAPGAQIERVPMLRGRITAVNGVPAEAVKPTGNAEWVLEGDRGLTYTDQVPKGSTVVEGQWWDAGYRGAPLVSMEKRIADGLGLKLGDTITVNVLGRSLTATIANLRAVDWQSMGINFVLVFTPNTFAGAPHTHLATLSEPAPSAAADAAIIKAVAARYPTVTSVRVRDAITALGNVVEHLVMGIRGASAVTLVAAMLVLAGALAAGHRQRVYDAVILKTLGATRARLVGAYAVEYLLVGLASAVFGVVAGSFAAWLIVTRVMTLTFVWQATSAAGVVLAALVASVGLGLVGTWFALSQKPAPILRNL
jgi:putative ABC transport system permease protein